MKLILFVAFLSTFSVFRGYSATIKNCSQSQTAYPPDPESGCCGIQNVYKIIRGTYTAIDQYPWLTLIEYDTTNGTKFLCGGSLISSRYVLTAAHCITGPALDLITPKSIRLGEHDTGNDGLDCEDVGGFMDCADPVVNISIEEVIPHPNYDLQSRRNDIALIRLKSPAPYTDFIQPICLPTVDVTLDPKLENIMLWAAGWGTPSKGILRNYVKQQIRMPYVAKEICQQTYNVTRRRVALWEKQMCAGGKTKEDTCKSDSGGPLMFDNPRYFDLVGITNFGSYRCEEENIPAVYTKVFAYRDWILSTIRA